MALAYPVEEIDSGCCGMAGSFGFEKEHYDVSMAIGRRRLFPLLKTIRTRSLSRPEFPAGSRSNMRQAAEPLHPAEALVRRRCSSRPMLRRYIEQREQFLHGRDNNRKSLPFEWGAEHLGIHANGNASAAVHDYVSQRLDGQRRLLFMRADCAITNSMARSSEVSQRYRNSVSRKQYGLGPILSGRQRSGRRRSASVELQMGRPGRALPRAATRGNHLAAAQSALSPPPQTGSPGTCGISRVAQYRPDSDRSPPGCARCTRAADWLFQRGYRRVGILGTSVGSCIGFLTFAHDERFSTGVFIHVSSFFADVVWNGLSTTHVRKSLRRRSIWNSFDFCGRLSVRIRSSSVCMIRLADSDIIWAL